MAIHTNEWHPDTCGCVLKYSWDDVVPVEERVHTPLTHNDTNCSRHNDLGTVVEAHDHVLEENQRKNRAYATVLEWAKANDPAHVVVQEGYESLRESSFAYRYDDTGVLIVDLPDMSQAQKASIRSHLRGKVSVT